MFIYLFLLWIMLSSRLTLEIILLGVVICLALMLFVWRVMGYSPRTDLRLFRIFLYAVAYAGLLIWEIFKSTLHLGRIIFSRKMVVKPAIYTFSCPLNTGLARVIFANSITLTPGTITISQEGDSFTVHGLHPDLLTSLPGCSFVRLLSRMEAIK